jgi:GAF domain-containing protein
MQADIQAALATLNTTVTNLTTVNASAIALLNGLTAQYAAALANAASDADAVAAVTAINTAVGAQTTSLASAVTTNTPAATPGQ